MSEDASREERVAAKIEAAQARLRGDLPARRVPPDAYPPEQFSTLAGEYPFLTIAGGLALGALIGSMVPRNFGGKAGKSLAAFASLAAEAGLAIAQAKASRRNSGVEEDD